MIQTQGFQTSTIPKFTAVDPSVLALNPENATNGILTSFRIADTQSRLSAFKALQDELNATRQGRIASENAGNELKVAEAGTRIPILSTLANADRAAAVAKTANAENEASAARGAAPFQSAIGAKGAEAALSASNLQMLTDKLKSQTMGRAAEADINLKLADTKLKEEQAKEAVARASEALSRGKNLEQMPTIKQQIASERVKAMLEQQKMRSASAMTVAQLHGQSAKLHSDLFGKAVSDAKALGSIIVSDPETGEKIPTSQMFSKLYNEDGTPKQTGFFTKKDVKIDPITMEAVDAYRQQTQIVKLHQQNMVKALKASDDAISAASQQDGPPSFEDEDEANEAISQGLIKPGDVFYVGGRKATLPKQ